MTRRHEISKTHIKIYEVRSPKLLRKMYLHNSSSGQLIMPRDWLNSLFKFFNQSKNRIC